MNIRTVSVLSFVLLSSSVARAQQQIVARHSGKCAAVEMTRNGSQVVQRTCDASRPDQQWQLRAVANGVSQIVSTATNDCLDVEGAAVTEGAHVKTFGCKPTNNLNQQWLVRATPQGSQLVAVHSQRCLNVAGADAADGARLVQGDCGDKPSQLFDVRAIVNTTGLSSNAATSSSGAEPLAGEWRWFNGATITIRTDGTMQGTNNQRGKWAREPNNRYVLTWDEGWIDRVLLSSDSRRLQGSNQNGTQISAERLGNAPTTTSTGPVEREARIDPAQVRNAANRDCGTGSDDTGCAMNRNGEYPMDAAAFKGFMTALKATPAEPTRVGLTKSLLGNKLITAMQLGLLIDLFRSETQALDAVRNVVHNVVDPDHLAANTTRFRSTPNKMAYAKVIAGASTNTTTNDRIDGQREGGPARIDLRRR